MQVIENLILDMDGVLWRGATPLPGLASFFQRLDALGINFVTATNNASKTVEQYLAKFASFGVQLRPDQIITSAEATGSLLETRYPRGTRAFVLGGEGLFTALRSRGFEIANSTAYTISGADVEAVIEQTADVDLVVVSFTREADYPAFARAAHYINRGAHFVGTNPDNSFPTTVGPLPGAGSFLALLQAATGVEPLVIGKPHTAMFVEALRRLGSQPHNTAMVGDRIGTDITGARAAGLHTILVMSGITTVEELREVAPKPDYVFDDITALIHALSAAHASAVSL